MPIDLKLVEEAAEFYAKNARMPEWYDVPADAVSRLLRAAPEMYALLKEVADNELCPFCSAKPGFGHAPDCRLAAVLKAVEGNDNA